MTKSAGNDSGGVEQDVNGSNKRSSSAAEMNVRFHTAAYNTLELFGLMSDQRTLLQSILTLILLARFHTVAYKLELVGLQSAKGLSFSRS